MNAPAPAAPRPATRFGALRLSPWRAVLAATSGLLLALAFPPTDAGWLGWVALLPLLVAVRDLRPRSALAAGLTSGTLFFALLMAYIRQFGLLPWLALALFQGLFLALFGYLASLMWRCGNGWLRVGAVGAAWAAAELLRGYCGALQFTFGDLGYSQHRALWILQLSSLVGHYGLGFAMALFGAAVVEAAPRVVRRDRAPTGGPLVILTVLLLVALVWGAARAAHIRREPTSPGLEVLAVQASGDPEKDDLHESLRQIAERYIRRSLDDGVGADLIVWPETAVPAQLDALPTILERVRTVPRERRCMLLAGAAETGAGGRTYNTLFQFAPDGKVIARYRKQRLVVFGEYVPWRDTLTFLKAYPIRSFDYSPGREDVLMQVGGARVAPMICFESIFPDVARRLVRAGADVLVVATSDFWVGDAPAELRQHAQCATFRAVETGRWVIRAAGTGVTCLISPSGRLAAAAPIFEEGSVRGRVRRERSLTLYDRAGEWPLVTVMAALLLGATAHLRLAKRRQGGAE